ncbi:MAG: hypothetical protein WC686_00715 [Candidatus Shapirobacteria bacterium]|jgi:hypothetical protein
MNPHDSRLRSKLLTFFLAVIFLFTLAFVAYQQEVISSLDSKVTSLNYQKNIPSPLPTQVPTPTPIGRIPEIILPTPPANWLYYTNQGNGYSFKYSPIFENLEAKIDEPNQIIPNSAGKDLTLIHYQESDRAYVQRCSSQSEDCGRKHGLTINFFEMSEAISDSHHPNLVFSNDENIFYLEQNPNILGGIITSKTNPQRSIYFNFQYNDKWLYSPAHNNYLLQILSTFRFTDQDFSEPTFSCPKTKYHNCMPIVADHLKKFCTKEYLDWVKINCPGVEILH